MEEKKIWFEEPTQVEFKTLYDEDVLYGIAYEYDIICACSGEAYNIETDVEILKIYSKWSSFDRKGRKK